MITFDHEVTTRATNLLETAKHIWNAGLKIEAIKLIRIAGKINGVSHVGLKEAKEFCEASFENVPQPGDIRWASFHTNYLVCITYDATTKSVFYRTYDSNGSPFTMILPLNRWRLLRSNP